MKLSGLYRRLNKAHILGSYLALNLKEQLMIILNQRNGRVVGAVICLLIVSKIDLYENELL